MPIGVSLPSHYAGLPARTAGYVHRPATSGTCGNVPANEEYPSGASGRDGRIRNATIVIESIQAVFRHIPTAYRKRRAERYEEFSTLKKESLKPEILTEPELKLVYIRIIGRYGEEEPYIEAWRKLRDFLQINGLLTPSTRWIGISFDDPTVTKTEQCRFYACATVEHDVSPQGAFGMKTIPQGRYAVYTLRGSYSGLQEMYDRIYSHPLPTAFRDATSFEEYLNCEPDTEEKDYVTRIYIPIE